MHFKLLTRIHLLASNPLPLSNLLMCLRHDIQYSVSCTLPAWPMNCLPRSQVTSKLSPQIRKQSSKSSTITMDIYKVENRCR